MGARSQLQAADLRETILTDANLTGAEYDHRTKFPEGFDPVEKGMVFAASEV